MGEPTGAVFLSYASQDADAARRIADALRADGIEVWFDQSELVGGDAWDQKIKSQIKTCALFVPVISAHTNARLEGYFRREWRMAVDRMHDMDDDMPFLAPVVVDETTEATARVPERFRERQWTRLPVGETSPAFCARVKNLLSGDVAGVSDPGPRPVSARRATIKTARSHRWLWPGLGILFVVTIPALVFWTPWRSKEQLSSAAVALPPSALPVTAAQELTRNWPKDPELNRAMDLINSYEAISEDYALAEDLALAKVEAKSSDAEAVTVMARVQSQYLHRGFDVSDERYAKAKRYAERATQLAPDDPEALYALAICLNFHGGAYERVVSLLRQAMTLAPHDASYPRYLARVNFWLRPAEGLKESEEVAAQFPNDVLAQYDLARNYRDSGRVGDMEGALERTIALYPLTNAIVWQARMRLWVHGDPAGMKALLDRVPQRSRGIERVAISRFIYSMVSGQTEDGLEALRALPNAWIEDFDFAGPKHMLQGELLVRAGKPGLARLEFEAALAEVNRQKDRAPTAVSPRAAEVWILHRLGRAEDARAGLPLVMDSVQRPYRLSLYSQWMFQTPVLLLMMGEREAALQLLKEASEKAVGRQLLRTALRLDPLMAPWRDDPEIKRLVIEPAKGSETK